MSEFSEEIQNAFKLAQGTRERAHAPYSGLKVGAAIKVRQQSEWITGCNMENVSYGGTLCAERTAMGAVVSKYGFSEIEALVLTSTSPNGVIPPCGLCLQVLSEFCKADFPVYLGDADQLREKRMFSELYPHFFSADMLPDKP